MKPLVSVLAEVDLLAEIDAAEARVRDVRARQVALIAEVERRGIPAEHGSRSTASWVRDRFNIADDEAKTLVLVGRAVEDRTELSGMPIPPDLPATATALNDGAITITHARAIVDGVAKLPPGTSREQRADTDALLATDAQKFTPHQVRMLAERVRYNLDQDGALREEEQHLATRELRFGVGRDGMTVLNGRLDRETGAKLKAALEPLAAPRPSEDGEKDPRPAEKRNADAFDDLLDIALGVKELPRSGGQRPHLTVTVDYAQLQQQITAGRAGGSIENTGQAITADSIRRIACDAEVLPIVLGGEGQSLNIGRARRTAPPHLRAALHARDGKCAFPGCDHPPGTGEAHHIQHWVDGGATNLDNMIMLCAHHHRTVHGQRWDINVTDGRPVFIPPAWIDPQRLPRAGGHPPHRRPLIPTG